MLWTFILFNALHIMSKVSSKESPRWTKKKRFQEMAAKAKAGKRLKIEATRASQVDDSDILNESLVLPVLRNKMMQLWILPHFLKMML